MLFSEQNLAIKDIGSKVVNVHYYICESVKSMLKQENVETWNVCSSIIDSGYNPIDGSSENSQLPEYG